MNFIELFLSMILFISQFMIIIITIILFHLTQTECSDAGFLSYQPLELQKALNNLRRNVNPPASRMYELVNITRVFKLFKMSFFY